MTDGATGRLSAMGPTGIRWVVLRVTVSADGAKASEVLGEVEAQDRAEALVLAERRYTKRHGELAVVSKLSWDMSMEEKARLARRRPAHLGSLNYRSGGSRKKT